MKKLLTTTAIAICMAGSAFATNISTDFFKSNGYTKPSITLVEIQEKLDNGTYYNYPYVVGGGVEKGLFKDKLKPGTAIPQIRNVTKLLAALDKKQVVKVASLDGNFQFHLPIFVEIAKQNGVTVEQLMAHLTAFEMPGEDGEMGFFSNIDAVVEMATKAAEEIAAEIGDEVQEEISEEISNEIMDAVEESFTIQDLVDAIHEGTGLNGGIDFTDLAAELNATEQEVRDAFNENSQEVFDGLSKKL